MQRAKIANFHMLFNISLAILFLPLINKMATLTEKLLPELEVESNELKTHVLR